MKNLFTPIYLLLDKLANDEEFMLKLKHNFRQEIIIFWLFQLGINKYFSHFEICNLQFNI